MQYVFWFFWCLEVVLVLWLFFQHMRQAASPAGPYVILGLAWVAIALFLRVGLGWYSIANSMVGILAIPIVGYGLFLAAVMTTKGPHRWN